MAKNLRAKIPTSDKLIICDRNTQATDNFVHEVVASSAGEGGIEVVKSPRQVAEQSVSTFPPPVSPQTLQLQYDEHVLPMI